MKHGKTVSALYLCVLFVVSVSPPEWLPSIHPDQADLLHAPAYGVLALFLIVGLRRYRLARSVTVLMAIAIAVTCGVITELSQAAVPGRAPSLSDGLLNTAGILAVCACYLLIASLKLRQA